MDIDTIQSIIENSPYGYFGLRAMTPNYYGGADEIAVVGQILPDSYIWDDNESTGEQINGTCAITVTSETQVIHKALKLLGQYDGHQVALIGSYSSEYGEDEQEIILRSAEVLEVWNR